MNREDMLSLFQQHRKAEAARDYDAIINVARFRAGRMAGESIYFDLATLCDQSGLPIDKIRTAAQLRAQALRKSGHAR